MGALLLLGLAFFALRNVILRSVLDSKLRSYESRNAGAVVRVGAARFSGLAGIDLENIQVRTAAGDLAVSLRRQCSIQVSFWKMLTGQVRLKRLALSDLGLDLRPGPLPARSRHRPAGKGAPAPPPGRPGTGRPTTGPGRRGCSTCISTASPTAWSSTASPSTPPSTTSTRPSMFPRLAIRGPGL